MSDSPEEVAYSAVAEKWFNGAQGYWVMKYIATAVAASREAGLLVDGGTVEYATFRGKHMTSTPGDFYEGLAEEGEVIKSRRVGPWTPVVDVPGTPETGE